MRCYAAILPVAQLTQIAEGAWAPCLSSIYAVILRFHYAVGHIFLPVLYFALRVLTSDRGQFNVSLTKPVTLKFRGRNS